MARRTITICDRCGAEHVQQTGSDHNVRQVSWEVPTSMSLHGGLGRTSKELCFPCRNQLSEIITTFIKGGLK